ncbi:hypothetical protein [Legionella fairfieldensis]|uniref:hypothetical protein n=1 Tax=Legionella fairfieldensis TaxID=45064 RepID=UPI0004903214|nr:hypothetical protein [Legionella fairfieldensis]
MKKTIISTRLWLLLLSLLFTPLTAQAALPKFSIVPVLRPLAMIPANGVALAQYWVTNNTNAIRTLTMTPIAGVNQLTGTGICTSPFTLAPGQSCLLSLQLIGNLMIGDLHTSPTICKTMGTGDNRPDPFLCSQASFADRLEVRLGGVIPITISSSSTTLALSINAGGSIIITNTNNNAVAENIGVNIISGANFFISGNTCPILLMPGASCAITFNTTTSGSTGTAIIQGKNTNPLTISMTSVAPAISVTPAVSFIAGNGGAVQVYNASADAYAANVTAILPPGANFSIASNNCPALLSPGGVCTITFNAVTAGSLTVPIQGSNTNSTNTVLTATLSSIYEEDTNRVNVSTSASSVVIGTSLSTVGLGQSVIVVNLSSSPALNIEAVPPAGSTITANSTCPVSLPPFPAFCTITFSSNAPVSATLVTLQGSNTTANTVTVTDVGLGASPQAIRIPVNGTGTITVQNNSSINAATFIETLIPPSSLISVTSNNCFPDLAASSSCSIEFTAGTSTETTPVTIVGHNSTALTVIIEVTNSNDQ